MKQHYTTPQHLDQMSKQDCSIIAYLADGCTHEQIAERCGLTTTTVEQQLAKLMQKKGVNHSYELISWAYLYGFLK